jgi:hypothetical protein
MLPTLVDSVSPVNLGWQPCLGEPERACESGLPGWGQSRQARVSGGRPARRPGRSRPNRRNCRAPSLVSATSSRAGIPLVRSCRALRADPTGVTVACDSGNIAQRGADDRRDDWSSTAGAITSRGSIHRSGHRSSGPRRRSASASRPIARSFSSPSTTRTGRSRVAPLSLARRSRARCARRHAHACSTAPSSVASSSRNSTASRRRPATRRGSAGARPPTTESPERPVPTRPADPRCIRRLRSASLAAAVIIAATVLLTGCGSTDASTPASAGSDPAVQYARCLRSHGLPSFPDPSLGHPLTIPPGVDTQAPAFRAAQQACAKLIPNGNSTGNEAASRNAELVKLARCMRANGVPTFADPSSSPPPPATGTRSVVPAAGSRSEHHNSSNRPHPNTPPRCAAPQPPRHPRART